MEALWFQFSALLPDHPVVCPTHPLGCHRPRVPDRVVFEHVVAALVHGSGYEVVASSGCSESTIRRRRKEWAELGLAETLHTMAVQQYDRMIGVDFSDLSVDGCITKAPCGGEKAGRSPVDRGKGGLKRSTVVDGRGVPLHLVSAPANRNDSPLLGPTLAGLDKLAPLPEGGTAHLDAAYDNSKARAILDERGLLAEIARKGIVAPIQVGLRWVVERTNSWMNGYGKLRRCTETDAKVVDFYLFLAAAIVTARAIIREARKLYRWPTRPNTRRLK